MTIENTEKQSTKTGPNPADLSREVFKNPQEVLSVLKDNFKKLSANHADSPMLMKNDLIAYATTGADPKVRAAAGIAASHFDDLTKISKDLPVLTDPYYGANHSLNPPSPNITEASLQTAIDVTKGKDLLPLLTREAEEAGLAGGTFLGMGASAVLTGVLTEFGQPAAVPGVAITAGWAGMFGRSLGSMVTAPVDVGRIVESDQKLLRNWKEINGSQS